MGVSRDMVDEMAKTPFSSITQLLPYQLKSLKLVTTDTSNQFGFGSQACTTTPPSPNCQLRTLKVSAPQLPGSSCGGSTSQPNCKLHAGALPPPDRGEAIFYRMRASGACEPMCPEWIQ